MNHTTLIKYTFSELLIKHSQNVLEFHRYKDLDNDFINLSVSAIGLIRLKNSECLSG